MRKIIMMAACIASLNGCTNFKYPNWEYVRIEDQVPSKECVYKMQDACSLANNSCLDWHKQRATKFNANTVVIISKENQSTFAHSGWTGNSKGGENSSTIAEYYFCNGPKNIKPS